MNTMIAFVMAIDLVWCTFAGFEFLHTFGGLFLFYTLVATLNAHSNFQENAEACWNGNNDSGAEGTGNEGEDGVNTDSSEGR